MLAIVSVKISAVPMYDAGPLNFSTNDQSMWSGGPAFVSTNEIFLGPEWEKRHRPDRRYHWWRQSNERGHKPFMVALESLPLLSAATKPDPKIETVTIDTRTGAQLDNHLVRQVRSLEFGYSINSGSVDANVGYSAKAVLPTRSTKTDVLIDLKPVGFTRQWQHHVTIAECRGVDERRGRIEPRRGRESLPGVNRLSGRFDETSSIFNEKTLEILSLDPNALEVLPNLLPGAGPSDPREALISLDTTPAVELSGGLTTTPNPPFVAPAFEVSAGPLSAQFPPSPGPTVFFDLAEITFDFPIIATKRGFERRRYRDYFRWPVRCAWFIC